MLAAPYAGVPLVRERTESYASSWKDNKEEGEESFFEGLEGTMVFFDDEGEEIGAAMRRYVEYTRQCGIPHDQRHKTELTDEQLEGWDEWQVGSSEHRTSYR